MSRCPYSIRYGTSSETTSQCDKEEHLHLALLLPAMGANAPHDHSKHEGPGLPQFPSQRIQWIAGDRREYTGDWPGYCTKLPGAPFMGGCCLPQGHRGRCEP